MKRLNWGLIGGGAGSQIGPAHRLGAQADGHFALVAGGFGPRPRTGQVLRAIAWDTFGSRLWHMARDAKGGAAPR